jgi:hypothetical protein
MKTPLTKSQKEIMQDFYSIQPIKTVFSKSEYGKIWKLCKKNENIENLTEIEKTCPAIVCEIRKSQSNAKNIQSAVFSECVYAQTLANVFKLNNFYKYTEKQDGLTQNILNLLSSYFLYPRYVYANADKSRLLIQAGGCNGIDSALIQVWDNSVYSIEFKEKSARATSSDLPKYKENGIMAITKDFIEKYPYYEDMLKEHKTLNFFEIAGHNICDFSVESIKKAIVNNYNNAKKYADVIVTADKNEYLTMLPANQVDIWAKLEGEIRAGRNKYKVWTLNKLKQIISEKCGNIIENTVVISKKHLTIAHARGGEKASRYKISPIFFVYIADCKEQNDNITFDIENIWQLNPVITAKMFFNKLDIKEVISYYSEELKK